LRLTQQGETGGGERTDEQQGTDTSTEGGSDFDVELVSAWDTDRLTEVVSADGDFVARTFDGIRRIRPDGSTAFETTVITDDKYRAAINSNWRNALHVSESGMYIGASPPEDTAGARMYAVDPSSGEQRWTFDEPSDGLHNNIRAVTQSDDTLIYASMSSGSGSDQEPIVRALNADTGREQWQITLSESFVPQLVTYENQLFVQQTFGVSVYDLSTQEQVESYDLRAGFNTIRNQDSTLYVPSSTVQALRLPSLETVWETETEYDISTRPAIGSTGVFYGTEAGFITGFNIDTGEQLWENRVSGVISHPPVVADGLVWVGNERGGLSAYTERTGERVYQREIAPDFTFAIQDGILVTNEAETAFEIQRPSSQDAPAGN
jgi:outer membrane protein assembly factor BamB